MRGARAGHNMQSSLTGLCDTRSGRHVIEYRTAIRMENQCPRTCNASKLALFLGLALLISGPALGQNVLTAVKAAQAPKLEALASDPAWAKAPELKVSLSNGMNFNNGATTAQLKAVYTPDTLFLLIQYADPTQSVRRSPYVKQADGSWKKLSDPDDKGGDNNKYYEDKVALIWNVGNSIKGFDSNGCFVMCHAGEQANRTATSTRQAKARSATSGT